MSAEQEPLGKRDYYGLLGVTFEVFALALRCQGAATLPRRVMCLRSAAGALLTRDFVAAAVHRGADSRRVPALSSGAQPRGGDSRRDASLTLSLLLRFQKWHPDKHPGDEAAKAFFHKISEAYHGARPPRSRRRFAQGSRRVPSTRAARARAAGRAYFSAPAARCTHAQPPDGPRHARGAVLSDPFLRAEFDKATEFFVERMALDEYLHRFHALILTVNGLGSAGWGDEEEPIDPLLLAFHAGAPARGTGARCVPPGAAAHSCGVCRCSSWS